MNQPEVSAETLRGARAKLKALTGLRIVAAGMILVHHSPLLHIPRPEYAWSQGVSFFFVLSGFILAYAYPKLDRGRAVFDFLAARIARIWPAHVMALLLAIVLLRIPIDGLLLANAFLLHAWVPSWPWYFSYNAPSWSISTELFFYFVFPALIWNWRRTWWWKWILSAALIAALIRVSVALQLPDVSQKDEITAHGLLYVGPLARLFEFTSGMVAYLAFQRIRSHADALPNALYTVLEVLVLAAAAYLVAVNPMLDVVAPHIPKVGQHWLGYACNVVIFPFVILVFAIGRGALSKFFATAPMVLLGEISYSVYLVHYTLLVYYASHWVRDRTPDYVGLVVCVAATLLLSFTIWAAIEVPCRNAVKRALKKGGEGVAAQRGAVIG